MASAPAGTLGSRTPESTSRAAPGPTQSTPTTARSDEPPATVRLPDGRDIPGELTALLFGCNLGRQRASEVLVNAGIGDTVALLRIPVEELRFVPRTGRPVWDAVADHLRGSWGVELGALATASATGPPARAAPRGGPREAPPGFADLFFGPEPEPHRTRIVIDPANLEP